MAKLTKEQVGTWISELMPYVKNPLCLAPKGCFQEDIEAEPGKVIQYDAALMPFEPKFLTQSENLKALVELYNVCED